MKTTILIAIFACLLISSSGQILGGCAANCANCVNQACVICSAPFYWNGIQCSRTCPMGSGYGNGFCICSGSSMLYSGACVPNCPPGMFNYTKVCVSCQAPCKTCSQRLDSCDSCIDGYLWNSAAKTCVPTASCPVGQSLVGNACGYICPPNYYFLNSACLINSCPGDYLVDDSRRICARPQSSCVSPLLQQSSSCVLTCTDGYFASLSSLSCEPCPSNCQTCTNSFTCSNCTAGFTLSNGYCKAIRCNNQLVNYKGSCVDSCPIGTFSDNGICSRKCPNGLYFYNSRCYQVCPTSLSTLEACVLTCPNNYNIVGNTCLTLQQSCGAKKFYNAANRRCQSCNSLCFNCQQSSTYCTQCVSGYTLTDQNTCVLSSCPDGRFLSPYGGGCISCPTKCSTCNPDSTCINCANGYTKTNNDCLPNSNNNPVTLTLQSAYKLGNTVVITLKPSVLPPNLPADKASDIVIPVPVLTIQPSTIAVANGVIVITISYSSQIPSTQLTFLLNSNAVGDLYSQMGYSSANVYVNVSISPNMPNSPIMATTFSTRNRYELIGGN